MRAMVPAVRATSLLGLLAATLAVTGLWLAFDNPALDHTSYGDRYTCLAPWDTVLNDADNSPGGEPPPDADQIGARCRDAGRTRFTLAVTSGAAAVVLAASGAVVAWRRSAT